MAKDILLGEAALISIFIMVLRKSPWTCIQGLFWLSYSRWCQLCSPASLTSISAWFSCLYCLCRKVAACMYIHTPTVYIHTHHHSKSCFSCKYIWLYSTDCPHSSLSHEIKYRLHMPLFSVCQVVCLECFHGGGGGAGFVSKAVRWQQFRTVAMR